MQLDPIALAAGTRLIALKETTSTNKEALVEARMFQPVWVTAVTQTRGRGRHDRIWISPPGNLYASLGIMDPAEIDRAPELAFVAALAVRDAVAAEAPALAPLLTLKWPNDLLLDDRKCAGILIEGEVTQDHNNQYQNFKVVIGVGVNCVSHPATLPPGVDTFLLDDMVKFPATDLRAHGVDVTAERLFTRLSATMCKRIAQWDRGAGLPAIRTDWLSHARGVGEHIAVRNSYDRELVGRFAGLDESGRLLLELSNGETKKIAAGDVFLFSLKGGRKIPSGPA
jgi:BirA family transcriptional regulator, biotin operon repressor / biotin---[acetyl-CoA-carboxylase] ligase